MVSPQEAQRNPSAVPAYRLGYLQLGTSTRLALAQSLLVLITLGLVIALMVKEHRRVDRLPLVFMQTEASKMVPVKVRRATPNLPMIEAYYDYCIMNLYAVVNGDKLALNRLYPLMDRKVITDITGKLAEKGGMIREQRATITARVSYIDTSTPDRFMINRRLKKSYGSAYGFVITTTANGGGNSRKARWDFEIVFVPQTDENLWGLFITQTVEKYLNDPPVFIPADYRRAEDIEPLEPNQ